MKEIKKIAKWSGEPRSYSKKKVTVPWRRDVYTGSWRMAKQRHHFAHEGPYSQSYDFSSSHVRMWELDHKEGWASKTCCFQILVLEKTLTSPLDSTRIKPVNPKGNQPWIFIGRTDAEAEAPPDAKSQLIGKDPDAGKDWRQKEKGVTEDEMVGWHHWRKDMSLSKLREWAMDREAWCADSGIVAWAIAQ